MLEDLIYDVGMYDGSDTAYYLHRGYRVVAIEANPLLVDAAQERFGDEIDSGRLQLLNVAIHESPGVDLPFWISEVATCSSFSEGVATKYGRATPVAVRTESFDRILAAHGVPKYLKIDIETLDGACIAALDPHDLPEYVSIEAQPDGAETTLVELHRLGYRNSRLLSKASSSRWCAIALHANTGLLICFRVFATGCCQRTVRFRPIGSLPFIRAGHCRGRPQGAGKR